MTAGDKIKETIREEAERVGGLGEEAARSGAYLYPIKGILYYLSHRALWQPLASKLLPTLALGFSVFAGMFFFTYLPQAAVLALFDGPLAAVSAALLVLSESSTVFNVMAKALLVEDSLIDTFDGTLLSKGETSLVSRDRQIKSGHGNPIARLGKLATKPFAKFTPQAIIRYVMYLPLNFMPVVGTVVFIMAQGYRSGPSAHSRYFQLKGMSKQSREEWVEQRKGAYTSFGLVASLLEMVPIAGIFFAFTNTTGAALWAAELEKGSGDEAKAQGTSPALRDQAKKAS